MQRGPGELKKEMAGRWLLLVVLLAGIIPPALGEKPFSFADTPGKLPKHILPREYAIRVVPDVEARTFAGSVLIRVEVEKASSEIILNAADLRITRAVVDDRELPAAAVRLDEKEQLLTLSVAGGLKPGAHTIRLDYTGRINQAGYGLFHAPYQEQGTGARKVALGTQFEATDARRMFPCWDEPAFRARFQLTAVVPAAWTAISNMPVEEEKVTDNKREFRFGMTPSMPSYLNVLCAGEFRFVEKEVAGVKIRVYATKGREEWGKHALAAAGQVLEYFNDYFGTPYPLPKLDMIALPGGFSGAMENWGAITYFESVLLYDPANSSEKTKQDVYAVVAHEIAHQWFGNLVTMAWWDNLWLNEGFASWMGSKVTAHFNPQWEVWLRNEVPRDPIRRPGISRERAMEGDARVTTHPIQTKIETEAEASGAFDEITYNKGQALIRMLEVFLGEEIFRRGIRAYMKEHAYSNTTTADLWAALSEASGRPITEVAPAWTEQPGFPLVSVTRKNANEIALRQERFIIGRDEPGPVTWPIPLTYTIAGSAGTKSTLMRERDLTLPAPTGAIKFNAEGAGNYRVTYDEPLRAALLEEMSRLSVADRVNLLADTWALVQAGRASLSDYAALISHLPNRHRACGARPDRRRLCLYRLSPARCSGTRTVFGVCANGSWREPCRGGLGSEEGRTTHAHDPASDAYLRPRHPGRRGSHSQKPGALPEISRRAGGARARSQVARFQRRRRPCRREDLGAVAQAGAENHQH